MKDTERHFLSMRSSIPVDLRERARIHTSEEEWDRGATADAELYDALLTELKREQRAHAETLRHLAAESERRREAEAAGVQALRQLASRDASNREAHHRVKNTLQIVSSLLSLQATATNQAETRRALQEASARLHLLSHVHECLSSAAAQVGEVCVSRLIRTMVDALPSSFAETCSNVRLHVKAEEMSMSAEKATALALIANELVTNAYKHAFPDNRSGVVMVELEIDESGSNTVLRISDNGVGHPPSTSANGFGASIVRTLAEQLGGTLELARPTGASGTIATLSVPTTSQEQAVRSTRPNSSGESDQALRLESSCRRPALLNER